MVVVANSLVAASTVMGVKTRHQGLLRVETHLRALAREIADVRALTCASDLNDSFARSQIEIRALLASLANETGGVREPDAPAVFPLSSARAAAPVDSDWPYLAF